MRVNNLWRCCLLLTLFGASKAQALQWADLWQRSDQRLQEMVELKDFEQAEQLAVSDEQRALVKFRADAFEEAAALYGQGKNKYNSGTSLVRSGAYEEAVSAFDAVSEQDPHYDDAMHNKKIAQSLAELAEQREQDGESDDGEGEGEPQPSQGEGEEGGEEQQDSQGSQSEAEKDDAPPEDAEASAEADEPSAEQGAQPAQAPDESHDEQQQTMDQWLQQVPDDPAGLLRARIIREHQRNYSQSRDREQAW